MAGPGSDRRRSSTSPLWFAPLTILLPRTSDSFWFLLAILSSLSLLLHHLHRSTTVAAAVPDFEGFDTDDTFIDDEEHSDFPNIPLLSASPPVLTKSDPHSVHSPPLSDPPPKPSSSPFDFWDDDEFEGLPLESPPPPLDHSPADSRSNFKIENPKINPASYSVEVVCIGFLVAFAVNYFIGRKENDSIALAWVAKFGTKDSIFDKNFSFLGVGKEEDCPLLLKEGNNVFKFYASGRRYCQSMVATMELKSRHDLVSRVFNMVVPCRDEMSFEVFMNEDAMDHVVFAFGKRKVVKNMHKEARDLQRFAASIATQKHRKGIAKDFAVISESKEVAADLITDTVVDQVFGDKCDEKYRNGFISMHFSDQLLGKNKKVLTFKFRMPSEKNMADMTRLVALVPYYIDIIGRYKLSAQARAKTEAARLKLAKEVFRELENSRQESFLRRKAERKMVEESISSSSSSSIVKQSNSKREAKERARQLKRAMPKIKMTKAN